jgi:hypothetical protein
MHRMRFFRWFGGDFRLRERVQAVIAWLFIVVLLTSHRDAASGRLVAPRGWVALSLLIGVVVIVFRDMLGRMGTRGHS